MLVGLRLMPNVLQGVWWSQSWHHVVAFANNCWTRSFALGYWLFYFSSVFDSDEEKTFTGKRLSQVSMYVALFTLALIENSQFLWQLVVIFCQTNLLLDQSWWGTWYLILVLSLTLRVYCLMRCTHNALQGVIMNSFDSIESYFGCVSCFWQDLQDLTLLDGMCITFHYFTDFLLVDLSGYGAEGSSGISWLPCPVEMLR